MTNRGFTLLELMMVMVIDSPQWTFSVLPFVFTHGMARRELGQHTGHTLLINFTTGEFCTFNATVANDWAVTQALIC